MKCDMQTRTMESDESGKAQQVKGQITRMRGVVGRDRGAPGTQGAFSTVFAGPEAPRWSGRTPVTTGWRSGLAACVGALLVVGSAPW